MTKFYGIGVGPGDSELITIKASNLLRKIDILYTPKAKIGGKSLALKIASPYLKNNLEVKERHFPMISSKEKKQGYWYQIASEIIIDVKNEKNVAFITLGDPMVYSTYSYLLELVREDIETQTIPGITSFGSIASELEQPLTMDEESFAVIPATAPLEKIASTLQIHDTVVLMKVAHHLDIILPLLKKYQLLENTFMVSNASSDKQMIIEDVTELSLDSNLSYFTTMIVKKKIL